MAQHLTRKRAVLAAGVLTLALAAVAFAFWSTTGSGTGTASTGSADTAAFAFSGGSVATPPSDLAPGVAAKPLSGTITNNGGETYRLNSITIAVSSVRESADPLSDPQAGCEADDYSLVDAAGGSEWVVTGGTSATLSSINATLADAGTHDFSGLGIEFNNSTTEDQSGCQGGVVHLSYAAA
jgi:hypothetical protein